MAGLAQLLYGLQIADQLENTHVTTKGAKDTKDSEIITLQLLNFVRFATFVVKYLFRFWLLLCPH